MKAYKVLCDDPDHGCSVEFADRAKDVSKYANSEFCDCEFVSRRIKRAPGLDKYAPGPMTTRDFINEGWGFECNGRCNKELHDYDTPIIEGSYVFCSVECANEMLSEIISQNYTHESFGRLKAAIESLLTKETPCPR